MLNSIKLLRRQNSLIPPYPNFEYQSKNETDVASGMIESLNQMRRVRTDHTNLDEKGIINWEQAGFTHPNQTNHRIWR